MKKKDVYITFPIEYVKGVVAGEVRVDIMASNAIKFGAQKFVKDRFQASFQHAINELGINYDNVPRAAREAEKLYDDWLLSGDSVLCSCKVGMLKEYIFSEKGDFDTIVFCAFLAIKSMLGTNPYGKYTDDYLIARLFGYSTCSKYLDSNASEAEKEARKKLSGRYQLTKIKNELRVNWGLVYYAKKTRGFYISFSMKYEALIFIAEKQRQSYKAKELKRIEEEARSRAAYKLSRK
ncbi:hypothetical protein [Flectobacillus rivi]|uniref:Uncharacterized protein n=1 Tax=Flectobacillus rivi TaxID=2984209 RepID=A0ABT6Z045_9BACT|nr:hypothetical protein [Flectobacillus rivi]MDI9874501.1 hypothetical protein [Flectobacillus rivi]